MPLRTCCPRRKICFFQEEGCKWMIRRIRQKGTRNKYGRQKLTRKWDRSEISSRERRGIWEKKDTWWAARLQWACTCVSHLLVPHRGRRHCKQQTYLFSWQWPTGESHTFQLCQHTRKLKFLLLQNDASVGCCHLRSYKEKLRIREGHQSSSLLAWCPMPNTESTVKYCMYPYIWPVNVTSGNSRVIS